MKNLGNVFKFEFFKLVNAKSFKITTIILIALIIIGFSIPTIMDAFGKPLFGDEADRIKQDKQLAESEDMDKYGVMIPNNVVNITELKNHFLDNQIIELETKKELEDLVLSEEIKAGYIINSPTDYEHIVNNSSMHGSNEFIMHSVLSSIYRENALSSKDIKYSEVEEIYNTPILSKTTILGKDSFKNYFYTYILIFGLYFIVLMYGQIIATSVASEKSNRSMEILVTSTSTESLIFGKVLSGAIVGVVQFAVILLVAFFSYKLNIRAWDNTLDFLFDVPGNILAIFSIFGTLGYLLYLFIYGTIGALVSKTEDIGTSMTPVLLIFIAAFFISMMGLTNPDMMAVKIASFIPFTSFMAMFVRVAMGNVPLIQVIISLILLAGTTVLVGVFASKIYRLGTLMYGNPVKIRQAIKLLRADK